MCVCVCVSYRYIVCSHNFDGDISFFFIIIIISQNLTAYITTVNYIIYFFSLLGLACFILADAIWFIYSALKAWASQTLSAKTYLLTLHTHVHQHPVIFPVVCTRDEQDPTSLICLMLRSPKVIPIGTYMYKNLNPSQLSWVVFTIVYVFFFQTILHYTY